MSQALDANDPDLEAERVLLEGAVAKARADLRYVSHDDMRVWLLELSKGNFEAPPPGLRLP